ncbi:MAG TPA: 4-hydroxy-tetrahydrodipicolinate reductase [Candidatus Elarobacter sp.]|jgi:4-hydroxy-tetrahydrodipicolinate reductase|nr:4-hydroxy-tetrahydrodipicolinate reductase [Candidatus Elarobacter sp.]
MLRVGVAGALGRLGRVACTAIEAADDLRLSAAFARAPAGGRLSDHIASTAGDVPIDGDLGGFFARGIDVVVDCTVQPVTVEVARAAVVAGVSPVIGSSGWSEAQLSALSEACEVSGVPGMWVPNFSFGAVLMMRFAAQAARVLPRAEIIELHHDAKRDAPSGTAKLTARRMRDAGAPEPAIHSVRLPGLVAHQEVIFGGLGETLTIRHDSLSRESFGPGIVAAVRVVRSQRGLVIGLDALIDRMMTENGTAGRVAVNAVTPR